MKQLLLTGASGFLGWNICNFSQSDWQIIGTYHNNPIEYDGVKMIPLDLTDQNAVNTLFEKEKIDGVLHVAALSSPNACAEKPELSLKINVDATIHLAKKCKAYQIPFLFTSSAQVFDGDHAPYTETDLPKPIHVYARHKLLAEQKVLNLNPNATVVRMPLMFGDTSPTSKNFLKDWLNKLRTSTLLNVFVDEYRVPASGQDAAEALLFLLEKSEGGLYHFGGKESISRATFADLMVKVFNITAPNINRCLQADVVMRAKRPKDLTLQCDKLQALGYELKGVEAELRKLVGQI